jgi:hypothetical protein
MDEADRSAYYRESRLERVVGEKLANRSRQTVKARSVVRVGEVRIKFFGATK